MTTFHYTCSFSRDNFISFFILFQDVVEKEYDMAEMQVSALITATTLCCIVDIIWLF